MRTPPRVLVVDDNPSNVDILRARLSALSLELWPPEDLIFLSGQARRLGLDAIASRLAARILSEDAHASIDQLKQAGQSALGREVTEYSLPIDLSWELDIWGKVHRTVEANSASAAASAADLEAVRLSAHSDLATNYFQLRALDAQRKLFDDTIAAYQRSLEITRNRYAAGVVSKADVVQAETQLKSTSAQATDLLIQRAQFEHAIAVILGKPPASFSIPSTPLDAKVPEIPVGLPSALLERRPDIAAAERRMAAANAQIGVAQAAYFPSLTLSASTGFASTALADLLTAPSHVWSLGPALAEVVFDGGARKAQTDQAKAAYDQAVANYRQTVLTGFQQVEDNVAALRILDEELRLQNDAVAAAKTSVDLTTNQYKAGTVTYLDVITTQTAELTGRRAAVTIQGNQLSAAVQLIKALGGGWESSALQSAAAAEH